MVDAARLRITLLDIDPAPWREVDIPLSMSFAGLHDTIQAAFLWHDAHLWEFEFGGKRYGLTFDDMPREEKVHKAAFARLQRLATAGVERFFYVYDFGDHWVHQIDIIKLFEADSGSRLPEFVAGAYRTPPEDIGGAPGFEAFMEVVNDPGHPDHDDLMDNFWDGFDPNDIEEEILRIQMARVSAQRRPKP